MEKKEKNVNKNVKCYFCGKECSGEKRVRVIEDADDELGVLVPVCDDCYDKGINY